MTIWEAYKVLDLLPETEWEEIKKRYRQLITQVHPDNDLSVDKPYAYNAQEINIAYSILKRKKSRPEALKHTGPEAKTPSHSKEKRHTKEKKPLVWDAPINENAYIEREIFHYVEDYDGSILGNICIARGKYLWKTEEDFPLFLLSVYKCSKQLLDEIDMKNDYGSQMREMTVQRQKFQAQLAYLLAQQFIDGAVLLKELATKKGMDQEGNKFFYLPAMLEPSSPALLLKAGETLYPSAVRNHKLYLKNHSGGELGYLSFLDDRLYYIVVPLFEQKRVQIKVQISETEKRAGKRAKTAPTYHNLHLWLKLLATPSNLAPENLNLQIEQLLRVYSCY